MQFDVVVSGLNVVDLLVNLPDTFEKGKKHQVDNIVIQGGAPAGNAACAMAQLGLKTGFLGFLGQNIQSKVAQSELERCKVSTELMLDDVHATPATALVTVDPRDGERTVFYSTTGYRALATDDIEDAWVKNTELVFVDGYDMEGNLELLRRAKTFNIPSVVDIEAGETEKLIEMLKLGGHVILPLEAAQLLSGKEDAVDCLHVLKDMTEAQLVITDGSNGSWALDGDTILTQAAFKVSVVDTTGCGDAYHGAYAYALLNKYTLAERMQFASAFAAIIACHLGGRTFYPSADAVHQFIKENQ